MKKYAEDSIGTSDYKTVAAVWCVQDQAKQIVRQSATLQKLYKKKVGDSSASMPTAPTGLLTATRRPRARTTPITSSNLQATSGIAKRAPGRTPIAPTLRPSLTMPLRPIALPISRP
ncbi:MAG: hypothetical protein ACLS3M_06690 [Collinsella sp.]